MNFASSAAFSVTASLIYKYKRTFFGSLIAFYSATAVLTAVMLCMNILVTPFYMGVPRSVVIENIPTLFLPFNLAKALLNSAIAMLLYKPVITSLRKAKLIKASNSIEVRDNSRFLNRFTIYTIAFALSTLAIAVLIFIVTKTKAA